MADVHSETFGGDIYPGQEKTFAFKVRLLGKPGDYRVAKASLSYRPKELKARYESSTSFTTVIQDVPLNFSFDLSSKAESGKDVQFRINYFSNIDYPLSDLRINAVYPSGFEFESSSPRSLSETEWELGILNKAEGGRIEITGKLFGDIGEQKVFRAELGIWQQGNFILLKEAFKAVEIIKPALHIIQQINGNPEYVASPGGTLHYEIFFKNIGEESLVNLFLVSNLEGDFYDFNSLKALTGEFEQGNNSIIFDWRKNSSLQFLDSQEEGKVEFWVDLKEDITAENPVIRNVLYLSQAREEFVNKVNSKLSLSQKGFFVDEVFGNSGPLPPRVGQTTTYTIMWQLKNHYNEVKDVKVKAVLGEGVKLSGKIFPEESGSFTFDSGSREVVWNRGDLGINEESNLSFQISFTPLGKQKGNVVELIGQAIISGEDQYTQQIIEGFSSSVDSSLPDDFSVTDGRVQ